MPTYERDGADGVRVRVNTGSSPAGERASPGTAHASTSGHAAASAPGEITLKDADGRLLTLREPDILQESRLVRALGDAALNAAYMFTYVLPASMVASIDGVEIHYPQNQMQVEAALKMVGRKGLATVAKHLQAQIEGEKGEGAVKN